MSKRIFFVCFPTSEHGCAPAPTRVTFPAEATAAVHFRTVLWPRYPVAPGGPIRFVCNGICPFLSLMCRVISVQRKYRKVSFKNTIGKKKGRCDFVEPKNNPWKIKLDIDHDDYRNSNLI